MIKKDLFKKPEDICSPIPTDPFIQQTVEKVCIYSWYAVECTKFRGEILVSQIKIVPVSNYN